MGQIYGLFYLIIRLFAPPGHSPNTTFFFLKEPPKYYITINAYPHRNLLGRCSQAIYYQAVTEKIPQRASPLPSKSILM